MADIDEFPWAALLFYPDNYQACEGVLISSTFVLTAARCLVGRSYDRFGPLEFVRLGEYNTLSDPDCLVVKDGYVDCNDEKIDARPQSIIVHPDYVSHSARQYHDIALIKLDQEIQFTISVLPILLPHSKIQSDLAGKQPYTVCSWGKTHYFPNEINQKSPIKMKAYMYHIEPQLCEDSYRDEQLSLGPGQFCAREDHRHYSCAGESGSPLMLFDDHEESWVLSGIVSREPGICGEDKRPAIYTNVTHYIPWIKANVQL